MTNQACKTKTCQEPAEFKTEFFWGGQKRTKVECLAHAAKSEALGLKVEAIRTNEQVTEQAEWEAAGIGTD